MKKSSIVGFTLIELIVVIAIAAVLLVIAIPSFQGIIINNRITTQANDFISGLALARSEAIRRGTNVRVTAAGADFSSGWTVWVDANADGSIDTDEALREHEALKSGFSLVGAGFTNNSEIQYRSTGTTNSTANGVFTLCYSGYTGRLISVSFTGRVSVTKTVSVCS